MITLTDIFLPQTVADINTAGNLTSAGVSLAIHSIVKESLAVSKRALLINNTILQMNTLNAQKARTAETEQIKLLTEILAELKQLNQKE